MTPTDLSSSTTPEAAESTPVADTLATPGDLLFCLPAAAAAGLPATLQAIASAFPQERVTIVADGTQEELAAAAIGIFPPALVPHWAALPMPRSANGWVLTAADFAVAARIATEHPAQILVLLGDQAAIDAEQLRALVDCVRSRHADLAVPRYHLQIERGLVNAAILYPITRALFGADIRQPLPSTAVLSRRMAQRLGPPAQRLINLGQGDGLLWPLAEAAIAGYAVRELDVLGEPPNAPASEEFGTLFNAIVGSLFTDIDAKASFWQRARSLPTRTQTASGAAERAALSAELTERLTAMIEQFRLAHANLQELWVLVLPPQSRLALKKLSFCGPQDFEMAPALWARIVYDFALSYRLRTLNRGHLLGAMVPIYLAWVASHLRAAADDPQRAADHLEAQAAAFDAEKSYIVSRWRWPDRFNP